MKRLFLACAMLVGVGILLSHQALADPPDPACVEDPSICQKCVPAVGKTLTGKTCTRDCSTVPCPTWHNCVYFTSGGCEDDTKRGVCTADHVELAILFVSDCTAYSDCPNPVTEDHCDWVPTAQICGQQSYDTCH